MGNSDCVLDVLVVFKVDTTEVDTVAVDTVELSTVELSTVEAGELKVEVGTVLSVLEAVHPQGRGVLELLGLVLGKKLIDDDGTLITAMVVSARALFKLNVPSPLSQSHV